MQKIIETKKKEKNNVIADQYFIGQQTLAMYIFKPLVLWNGFPHIIRPRRMMRRRKT